LAISFDRLFKSTKTMLLPPPVVGTDLLDWLWPKNAFGIPLTESNAGSTRNEHASPSAQSANTTTYQQASRRKEDRNRRT
jgi:hypothetical protein